MKSTLLILLLSALSFAQPSPTTDKPTTPKSETTILKTTKTFFIGKWKDENAVFKLKKNGKYTYVSLLQNGQNQSGVWTYKNNTINLGGLFEMQVLSVRKKQFTYKLLGGQTIFTAKKQKVKHKKHHRKTLITKTKTS